MKGFTFANKIEKALKEKRGDIIKVEFSRNYHRNVYYNIHFRYNDKIEIYETMYLDTFSFSKNIRVILEELDDYIEFIEGRCIL